MHMVIELLKFNIPAGECATFLERNEAIWTAGLREHAGFVRHDVWRDQQAPCDVYIAIQWESQAAWNSFPREKIDALNAQMGHAWPALSCQALEVLHSDPMA